MTLEFVVSFWFVFLLLIAGAELLENRDHLKSAKERWPTNLALVVISSGLAAVVPLTAFGGAEWARTNQIGLMNWIETPIILVWIISYLALSFLDFIVHLASHKIPLLWRFHKIHHSDHALDVTSTFRSHPVMQTGLIGVELLFVILLGLSPEIVLGRTVLVLFVNLSHHTTLLIPEKIDKALRRVIMTPRLHHLHHSAHVSETDTNYGLDLVIWDQLFRTYLPESKRPKAEFKYGLDQYPADRADDLNELLLAPFKGKANS